MWEDDCEREFLTRDEGCRVSVRIFFLTRPGVRYEYMDDMTDLLIYSREREKRAISRIVSENPIDIRVPYCHDDKPISKMSIVCANQ